MKTAIILTFLGLFGSLTDACCHNNCNGNTGTFSGGRMGSEITDDTVEPLAYAVCNTDGVKDSLGLKLTYVKQCIARTYLLTAQRKLTLTFFDADGNGILTWSEWKTLHG